MSKTVHVTFGVRYSREPHPIHDWVHPDGYVAITVEDHVDPHAVTHSLFGPHYAFVYPEDRFNYHYYPKGCLRRYDLTSVPG